jgi:hypothetical protein
MADQLRYRYGYGQTVLHILPPGDVPRIGWAAETALCQSTRVIYRAAGYYADVARSSRTCQRCAALWRKATGAPAPAKAKGPVTRDVQRQRLYEAEQHPRLPLGRTFRSEAEALAYAKALLASDWAQRHFGNVRVRDVRFTNGFGAYSYNGRYLITLGVGQRIERTLLHEIAHQIIAQSYATTIQAHGPLFARVVHALYQHKLGAVAATGFLANCTDKRVKVASPALLARQGARPTAWRTLIHTGRVPA